MPGNIQSPGAQAEGTTGADPYGVPPWMRGQAGKPAKTTPYDAALADARGAVRRDPEPEANTLIHGATMGFEDDIISGIAYASQAVANTVDRAQGKTPKYGADDASRAVRTANKEEREAYAKRHPFLAGAEEIGGGFLTPGLGEANLALKAKGVAGPLRALAIGGTVGAGNAVGNATGTAGQRLAAAPAGAGAGALFGLGGELAVRYGAKAAQVMTPYLAAAGRAVWQQAVKANGWKPGMPLTPEMNAKAEKAAHEFLQRLIERTDPSGEKLKTGALMERRGKAPTSAEALGGEATGRLKALMRRPGKTGDAATALLTQRRQGSAARVVEDFGKQAGIDSDAIDGNFDKQVASNRGAAAPLYEAAFSQTNVTSPKLTTLLERPSLQRALTGAFELAAEESVNPEEIGLVRVKGKKPLVMDGKPLVRADGTPIMMDSDETVEVKNPTMKTWDFIRRSLSDEVFAPKHKVPGGVEVSGTDLAVKKSLDDLRAELTREDAPWGPSYKAALDAGGEAPRLKEVWKDTPKIMGQGVTQDVFDKTLGSYTPTQLQAVKAAVVKMVRDAAAADTPRAALAHLGTMTTDLFKSKLVKVFGPEAGERLFQSIADEKAMIESGNKIMSGSDTQANRAFDRSNEDENKAAQEAVLSAASKMKNGEPWKALWVGITHAVQAGATAAQAPMDQAQRDIIGALLLKKPSELAKVLAAQGASPVQASHLAALMTKAMENHLPALAELAGRAGAQTGGNLVASVMSPSEGGITSPGAAAEASGNKTPDDPYGTPPWERDEKPTTGSSSPPIEASPNSAMSDDVTPAAYTPIPEVTEYLGHHLGIPVTITSGPRTAEHNAEVGGAEHSAHLSGEAYDFIPHGMTMEQAGQQLAQSGIPFDQIEITPTHVHISFAPAMRGSVIYVGGRKGSGITGPAGIGSPPPDDGMSSSDMSAIMGMEPTQ